MSSLLHCHPHCSAAGSLTPGRDCRMRNSCLWLKFSSLHSIREQITWKKIADSISVSHTCVWRRLPAHFPRPGLGGGRGETAEGPQVFLPKGWKGGDINGSQRGASMTSCSNMCRARPALCFPPHRAGEGASSPGLCPVKPPVPTLLPLQPHGDLVLAPGLR